MNAQQRRRIRRDQRRAEGTAPPIQMETYSPERLELASTTADLERSIERRDVAAIAVGIGAGAVIVGSIFALLSVLL